MVNRRQEQFCVKTGKRSENNSTKKEKIRLSGYSIERTMLRLTPMPGRGDIIVEITLIKKQKPRRGDIIVEKPY